MPVSCDPVQAHPGAYSLAPLDQYIVAATEADTQPRSRTNPRAVADWIGRGRPAGPWRDPRTVFPTAKDGHGGGATAESTP